jgi:DNA polymerase III epsilon subunit-like protein
MYENTTALARRIAKPVITFDLEHTGGAGAGRSVTDFGAWRVTPDGEVSSYSSLVKPPETAVFNPYVCKLTGIYPETVVDAPSWERVLHDFVLPNRDALWVGFACRSCDTPLVLNESRRIGHELQRLDQFDLMRAGGDLKGSLSVRLAQLVPDFDTSGAHRGLKDALMTLALLEAQLPTIAETHFDMQRGIHGPRAPRVKKPRLTEEVLATRGKRALDVSQFLVTPGTLRKGQPWTEDEVFWVCKQYRAKKHTVAELAVLNGRSTYGVACALFKEGVITAEERDQYKAAPV